MARTKPRTAREWHRKFAVDTFNGTWTLLEKRRRSAEDEDLMIHTAHASRFHWGMVGRPENWTIGEWQLSRVYAVLGRVDPALHHANRCLALCRKHRLGGFMLAFAYEALARSHALAGHAAERKRYLALAQEAALAVKEADDRKLVLGDLATVPPARRRR